MSVKCLWLDVALQQRNRRNLQIDDEQRNAGGLELLRQAGMIDVIVSGEPALDLVERDTGALQVGPHGPHRARPAEIHEEARSSCADDPIVRRAIANVDDGDG
jgi:hypothetical protein